MGRAFAVPVRVLSIWIKPAFALLLHARFPSSLSWPRPLFFDTVRPSQTPQNAESSNRTMRKFTRTTRQVARARRRSALSELNTAHRLCPTD
ncbi:hypothetical protein EVAR_86076_1 [Eumeta japonica]|uniref:Secreted protein n=1 Tax=Eumeta variegata TaxID=151549 RepID=A0A4C1UKS9_EUMVA|nr:hypothetical protein EVAR_86076_1 [Eumeta japonica]